MAGLHRPCVTSILNFSPTTVFNPKKILHAAYILQLLPLPPPPSLVPSFYLPLYVVPSVTFLHIFTASLPFHITPRPPPPSPCLPFFHPSPYHSSKLSPPSLPSFFASLYCPTYQLPLFLYLSSIVSFIFLFLPYFHLQPSFIIFPLAPVTDIQCCSYFC